MQVRKSTEMVPMRDGVNLATQIYFPEGAGPWPTMLVRHPYGPLYGEDVFEVMAKDDYVAIMQDERGRFASEGDWSPRKKSGEDGSDTCAWIVKQPWSDGQVGLFGSSYAGLNQWLTAVENPAGLRAISPIVGGDPFADFPYVSPGVLALGAIVNWSLYVAPELLRRTGSQLTDPTVEKVVKLQDRFWDLSKGMLSVSPNLDMAGAMAEISAELDTVLSALYELPLSEFTTAVEPVLPWVREWLKHPEPDDPYWKNSSWTHAFDQLESPALIIAGWYDLFIQSSPRDFSELVKRTREKKHKLVIGPWPHNYITNMGTIFSGERQFPWPTVPDSWAIGGTSQSGEAELLKRWFDFWMKDDDNGIMDSAPIQLYVMGENVLRDEYEWPLARTRWTNFYLRSSGRANSRVGDGELSLTKPGEEPPDTFEYDPANPVPTVGGKILSAVAAGAFNQESVEKRDDVLVFSTEPLGQDCEITGPITLHLWVSTTAVDTDFTGKLVDVFPDGTVYNLCESVTRLRYRKERPGLVTPDEVQKVTIELGPTSNLFKESHRIRLQVSSSNFPYFDPNPNTGKSLFLDESNEMIVATQTVFHDQQRPSHLVLPLIPR